MSAGTYTSDKNLEDCGLIRDHGYLVQALFEEDGDLKLVKLKNPQGDSKWNGDWNQESDLWTDELREKTGIEDPFKHLAGPKIFAAIEQYQVNTQGKRLVVADDGTFCMTFEDFVSLFSDTNICKLADDEVTYHSLCQKTKNVPEVNWFKFSLEDEFQFGEWGLDIVVQQMGNRIYRYKRDSDGIEFQPTMFQVTLVSVGGEKNVFEGIRQQVHYIKSTVSSDWQVYLQIPPDLLANQACGPGKYLLGVEAYWNEKAPPKSEFRQISVDIITNMPVKITPLKLEQSFCKDISNQAYCNLAV